MLDLRLRLAQSFCGIFFENKVARSAQPLKL